MTSHSCLDLETINIITFVIFYLLKTAKRNSRPQEVKFILSEIPALNICDFVLAYQNSTISLRAKAVKQGLGKPTRLILSWSTLRLVTKISISRWLTTTLEMAGINKQHFYSTPKQVQVYQLQRLKELLCLSNCCCWELDQC